MVFKYLLLVVILTTTSHMAYGRETKETTIKTCITQTAKQYGLSKNLLNALIKHESSYQEKAINPVHKNNAVTSYGLGQITIPTAKRFCSIRDRGDLLKHDKNIKCTAKILKHHINKYGNVESALSAYRAGTPCKIAKMKMSKKHVRICNVGDRKYIRGVLEKSKV